MANLNREGTFEIESEDLTNTGDWRQLTLYQQGLSSNSAMSYFTQAFIAIFTVKLTQVSFAFVVHTTGSCCKLLLFFGIAVVNIRKCHKETYITATGDCNVNPKKLELIARVTIARQIIFNHKIAFLCVF